ncbi:MAG: hypothetical protein M3169_09265, partial [Candidatus Eremiobacteraeota bacterium]|nr:hypothetical protein [Candidatus Eremiobacteraeota bacterium]
MTGSKATGHAKILVHTETQTVDVGLIVDGLKTDDLWTKLRNSPKGPTICTNTSRAIGTLSARECSCAVSRRSFHAAWRWCRVHFHEQRHS